MIIQNAKRFLNKNKDRDHPKIHYYLDSEKDNTAKDAKIEQLEVKIKAKGNKEANAQHSSSCNDQQSLPSSDVELAGRVFLHIYSMYSKFMDCPFNRNQELCAQISRTSVWYIISVLNAIQKLTEIEIVSLEEVSSSE